MERNIYKIGKELFITSDEEIKEGDYYIHGDRLHKHIGKKCLDVLTGKEFPISRMITDSVFKKIILTTDQDLIGVQTIDNEFLEWFVKNPSCEKVEIMKLQKKYVGIDKYETIIPEEIDVLELGQIIPEEESKFVTVNIESATGEDLGKVSYIPLLNLEYVPKQETLEEVAENYGWRIKRNTFSNAVKANELAESAKQDFIAGAKWQQERSYSEEEIYNLIQAGYSFCEKGKNREDVKKWFEQFKKK